MRIGELATAAQVRPETVRFYEKRGLLAAPPRTPGGYREYDNQALSHLRFIRTAQASGLTLVEIRSILELREDGRTPCGHVEDLLGSKLQEVRDRQEQLAALEVELSRLLKRSATLDPADCGPGEICHILHK